MKFRKKRAVLKFKQFDNLLISSNIFNTLKKFREKKQVAMWFNANSFDLSLYESIKQNVIYDCSNQEFVKGFDSENSNEDNSLIFINLEHYINEIILNSFLDNILFPLLDISILPNCKFNNLSIIYDANKKPLKQITCDKNYVYVFNHGKFIKDLIIWSMIMIFVFMLYKAF